MKGFDITLMFDGQTEEAFNFYRSVFGGEFSNLQRMSDLPTPMDMPESEKSKILHMALPIGETVLMGMDLPVEFEAVWKILDCDDSHGCSLCRDRLVAWNEGRALRNVTEQREIHKDCFESV